MNIPGENNTPAGVDENEGLPTVNRGGTNKVKTFIGFAVILVFGVFALYLVNKQPAPVNKKQPQNEQVKNQMPPLLVPESPAPIKVTPNPPPVVVNAQKQAPPILKPGEKKEITWTDRKMLGGLLIGDQKKSEGVDSAKGNESGEGSKKKASENPQGTLAGSNNALSEKLVPTVTLRSLAAKLPDRNYLITKGTTLDCALETAMDSTVPGLTTCRLTRDIYSDNGQVLLLDRGSKLVGEYQGGIKQGQARLFVLWTRAETPTGVIISLDSPGTDALGRSGLEGWVDNHFLQRFGAAIMMSMLQTSMQVVADNARSSGTTNYYGNTSDNSGRIIEKILDATINIPPTLIKNQGDHIAIMVARDLDFSGVYGLATK